MTDLPLATIDLGALRQNWRRLSREGAETGAVVKADAYGHGLEAVGKALLAEGCRSFFVAHAEEGLALRNTIGSGPDIYVLNGPSEGMGDTFEGAGLTAVINSLDQLNTVLDAPSVSIALKFDTGMNRLGLPPNQMGDVLDRLAARRPALVRSHLACADTPDHPLNNIQLRRFHDVAEHFPGCRLSLANSAGCFLGQDYTFDLTRPGIALYGGGGLDLEPVMTLEASVLDVFDGAEGSTVGYGASAHLDRPRRLATLAIGYGDGWLRSLSGRGLVWLGGAACRVIGRVSMDLTTVDVSDAGDVGPGDRAQLFGAELDLEAQARRAGSLGYELTTGLTPRVARRYMGA